MTSWMLIAPAEPTEKFSYVSDPSDTMNKQKNHPTDSSQHGKSFMLLQLIHVIVIQKVLGPLLHSNRLLKTLGYKVKKNYWVMALLSFS